MSTSRYELIHGRAGIIGEGAYGVVLKAISRETNEFVAIKRFKDVHDENSRKAITREVSLLRKLPPHPNVVSLIEAFRKKNRLYLVLEYCETNVLDAVEETVTGLSVSLCQKYTYETLLALAHMHSQGLCHRDVKPENLLIHADGSIRLCDFGFARSKSVEQMTSYVATRWFRPPELLLAMKYGSPVDIWGLGCVLAEMVTGQPLFPGDSEIDMLHLIQRSLGPLPPFYRTRAAHIAMPTRPAPSETLEARFSRMLPSSGIDFLSKCLKLDPQKRMSASQALQHPFLESERVKRQMAKVPSVVSSHCDEDDFGFRRKRRSRLSHTSGSPIPASRPPSDFGGTLPASIALPDVGTSQGPSHTLSRSGALPDAFARPSLPVLETRPVTHRLPELQMPLGLYRRAR